MLIKACLLVDVWNLESFLFCYRFLKYTQKTKDDSKEWHKRAK